MRLLLSGMPSQDTDVGTSGTESQRQHGLHYGEEGSHEDPGSSPACISGNGGSVCAQQRDSCVAL